MICVCVSVCVCVCACMYVCACVCVYIYNYIYICAARAAAIGLTRDGVWATTYLKEYPPALCAGLAHGFCKTLQQHAVDESVVTKSDFVKRAHSMIVQNYGDFTGPDFAK